ncbi:MAG: protein-disulfide reductase DsbD N-terminal domain-containing protein [Burkholderiales bacterium]|nr:protein-disulfide reductase DsbD N-terminal domain-containing protein [Burkholderiales bacterium]
MQRPWRGSLAAWRDPRPAVLLALVGIGLVAFASPAAAGERFLKPEQAFRLETSVSGAQVRLHWTIAPGYYLYRDRITVVAATPSAPAVALKLPVGDLKNDPNFGPQQVFHQGLTAEVTAPADARALQVGWQGCAEAGLCYLPQRQTVVLAAAPAASSALPR